MQTFYSDDHRLHHGQAELNNGQLMPCFEKPSRADMVLERVRSTGLGPVQAPEDFGLAPIKRVHDSQFVDFLKGAWARWAALGRSHDMLPLAWPPRRMPARCPEDIDGQLGYYSFDAGVPMNAGSWQAIYSSAQVALSAQARLATGDQAAFALCRPPGHHAGIDYMGGYCYLNNAAIATQALLDGGARKVAILDVDFHHGNGTQDIFYQRPDVLFLSIHGDPRHEYPCFAGYADERGEGAGLGYNYNYPLAAGSDWTRWSQALADALRVIAGYGADALVVSLGVDTYKQDPISSFKLDSPDYLRMGEQIASLGLPSLFVMEGGYAVEEIGINAVNVLSGFSSRR
ncbi:histone deacetylase family protein [Halopseudomonas phragmitis]|uniref:Acetylpolyamine amidohydrolase n=1 Tax=Halopseudomonas phragmitis TaxID=1931241 RepID=A0A1V0B1U8_9GAMM|nr:histone deacetylase family protein [Halopseudomonas phragmitis]AQZ93917.1 acetylpolyamine amidohydrolase [Halopseudomonas phragmitis]